VEALSTGFKNTLLPTIKKMDNFMKKLLVVFLSSLVALNVNAGLIDVDVEITSWTGFHTNGPFASCGGGVTNNIGGADGDSSVAVIPTCNESYGIDGANGSAASNTNGSIALASLNLDVTGEPAGFYADGLSSATLGGYSYNNVFSVTFNINATVTGELSAGSFGILVDAYEWLGADLEVNAAPITNSLLLDGTDHFNYFQDPNTGNSAWFFDYSHYDVLNRGGTLSDTVTATFNFADSSPGHVIDIATFAVGEVTSVPEPSTLVLFALAILGLGTRRTNI
jgi:hypothetical protein